MEEYNTHEFRELWVRNEERPSLLHEGPFLVSRRACSRTLKGVFHNLEWPPLYLRTMKIAYKHTLLNPPKQPCLIHKPTPNCPHLLPVSPQTHFSSSTKSWLLTTNPNLYRPRTHSAPSTSSSCTSTEPMVFRPRTHPAPSISSSCIIHWTHGVSSTNPLSTVYKFILYHPLNPWYFVHELILRSLQPPSHIASAPTFSTRSSKVFFFTTQKKKKQKTTVFYFFFFNLYFSSYTPYAWLPIIR